MASHALEVCLRQSGFASAFDPATAQLRGNAGAKAGRKALIQPSQFLTSPSRSKSFPPEFHSRLVEPDHAVPGERDGEPAGFAVGTGKQEREIKGPSGRDRDAEGLLPGAKNRDQSVLGQMGLMFLGIGSHTNAPATQMRMKKH